MWHARVRGGIIRDWLGRHRVRGAAVPFEAPVLRMARVCEDDRDGMIAILRDFANNGASYIVPWTSLPLMVTMTNHDLALHKGVGDKRATTPADVRAVITGLALSGALGAEAKAREVERARVDGTRLADVELVLILHLLRSSGADLSALTAASTGKGATDAKAAVTAAAAALGVRRQDIYQRISDLAKLLQPVGLVATEGPIQPGWLRVLCGEIEAFGQPCKNHTSAGAPDADVALSTIASAATKTAQVAGTVLAMVDYAVLDIGATIRRWNTEQPVLRQVIERLSLMLDEWPALLKMVRDALRDPQGDVAARLRPLLSLLPPSAELATPAGNDASAQQARSAEVSRILAAELSAAWSSLGKSRAAQ